MSFSRLIYHVIFHTLDKRPLITESVEARLYPILSHLVLEYGGVQLAVGGVESHIHLVCAMPVTATPSQFVRYLKSASSGRINRTLSMKEPFRWHAGYGILTVNPHDLTRLLQYVAKQKEHHDRRTTTPHWEAPLANQSP